MTSHLNPTAVRKAKQAADHLAKAANLMREAAAMTDGTIESGRGDFNAWAYAIEQLLSCDNCEAGIRPTLQMMDAKIPRPKTYPVKRTDGRIVNVTIPE